MGQGPGEEDTAEKELQKYAGESLGSLPEYQFAFVQDKTPEGLAEKNT